MPIDLAPPNKGEVTIEVRAAGMNPADYKHFAAGQDRSLLPLTVGYEASGVLSALGPGTEIATGGGAVGDEVVAFQIMGAYASHVTVNASDVFAKPANLTFPEAANLLLVGTTASEMLHVTGRAKRRRRPAPRRRRRRRHQRAPASPSARGDCHRDRRQGRLRRRRAASAASQSSTAPGSRSGYVRLRLVRSAPRWTRSAPTRRSTSPWR